MVYYNYRQLPEYDNETHLRAFRINAEVVGHYKGSLFNDEALIEHEKEEDCKNGVSHSAEELLEIVKERSMGTVLLKRSDMTRYAPLMVDIRDQYGFGSDVYPRKLALGHDMLEDYARSRNFYAKMKKTKGPSDKAPLDDIKKDEQDTGVMYSHETLVPGNNGKVHPTIKCHGCGKHGHCLTNCPEDNGNQHLNLKSGSDDKEVEVKEEGAQHMQIKEVFDESVSSSDNGS